MLGENGTEQFTITTKVDGQVIGTQRIHDPFLCNKTIIKMTFSEWVRLLFKREIKVEISVEGTQGIQRAIMMLDPVELEKETMSILEDRRKSRESQTDNNCYLIGD